MCDKPLTELGSLSRFNKAVKKTVTIPKWMSDAAKENGLKLSRLLQEAIKRELGLQ